MEHSAEWGYIKESNAAIVRDSLYVFVLPTAFAWLFMFAMHAMALLRLEQRNVLLRILDLLLLTQIVVLTTTFDSMRIVECNPAVIMDRLAPLGEEWSGNNSCLAIWCSAFLILSMWITPNDKVLLPDMYRFVGGLLLCVNGCFWAVYYYWGVLHQGPCRVARSSRSTSILFIDLSIFLVIAEYWVPNFTHSNVLLTGRWHGSWKRLRYWAVKRFFSKATISSDPQCGVVWTSQEMRQDSEPEILALWPSSPLQAAGLQVGDVVMAVNGVKMDLPEMGRVLTVQHEGVQQWHILRGKDVLLREVNFESVSRVEPPLGVVLDQTPFGVTEVVRVAHGSPAEGYLKAFDVVRAVNNKVCTLQEIVDCLENEEEKSMVWHVMRGPTLHEVLFTLEDGAKGNRRRLQSFNLKRRPSASTSQTVQIAMAASASTGALVDDNVNKN